MATISNREGYTKTSITENKNGTHTETVTVFDPITGKETITETTYEPTEEDKAYFEFACEWRQLVAI